MNANAVRELDVAASATVEGNADIDQCPDGPYGSQERSAGPSGLCLLCYRSGSEGIKAVIKRHDAIGVLFENGHQSSDLVVCMRDVISIHRVNTAFVDQVRYRGSACI
jgi:hypothetical protein